MKTLKKIKFVVLDAWETDYSCKEQLIRNLWY